MLLRHHKRVIDGYHVTRVASIIRQESCIVKVKATSIVTGIGDSPFRVRCARPRVGYSRRRQIMVTWQTVIKASHHHFCKHPKAVQSGEHTMGRRMSTDVAKHITAHTCRDDHQACHQAGGGPEGPAPDGVPLCWLATCWFM